jgi:hypothetical protein
MSAIFWNRKDITAVLMDESINESILTATTGFIKNESFVYKGLITVVKFGINSVDIPSTVPNTINLIDLIDGSFPLGMT